VFGIRNLWCSYFFEGGYLHGEDMDITHRKLFVQAPPRLQLDQMTSPASSFSSSSQFVLSWGDSSSKGSKKYSEYTLTTASFSESFSLAHTPGDSSGKAFFPILFFPPKKYLYRDSSNHPRAQNVSRPWMEPQRRYKSELRSTKHERYIRTVEVLRTPMSREWNGTNGAFMPPRNMKILDKGRLRGPRWTGLLIGNSETKDVSRFLWNPPIHCYTLVPLHEGANLQQFRN